MVKNKVLKIIVLAMLIFMLFNNYVYAISSPIDDPGQWKPSAAGSETKLTNKIGPILGAINIIGTVASVAVLMVIGIKYMLGSVEQKAEYKKTMITYLIGCILLFGTTAIPNLIYNWLN